jgi:mono/diheme cytochrome c family protein
VSDPNIPEDRFYHPGKLNAWFAASSLVLLAGVAGAVLADHYDREWKGYQASFFEMEKRLAGEAAALAKGDLSAEPAAVREIVDLLTGGGAEGAVAPEAAPFDAALSSLRDRPEFPRAAALAAGVYQERANALRRANDSELVAKAAALRAEAQTAEDARFRAEKDQKERKGIVDALKFEMDHARSLGHDAEAAAKEQEWRAVSAEEAAAKAEVARQEAMKNAKLEEEKTVLAGVDALETRATKLYDLAGVTTAHRRLSSFTLQGLRDAPILNSFAPVLKPEQDVFPDLKEDYNFAMVPRVDRCVTCHMGIDKVRVDPLTKAVIPLFTEENTPEKVFRTHPRPELFVSSVSAHTRTKVGCTVCHNGMGWGLSFNDAYHTPNDAAQEKEWVEKYHWHKGESWDRPMLPMKHVEAACFKCHSDPKGTDPMHAFAKEIPAAPRWNAGMRLVEKSGCFGCHKLDGWTVRGLDKSLDEIADPVRREQMKVHSVRKTGPNLSRLPAKIRDREAAFRWIWNPHALRPTSNMPRFFEQPNNRGKDPQTGEDHDIRTRAEVLGIVEYLFHNAEGWDPGAIPVKGDAARGKELFGSPGTRGCVACHASKDFPNPSGGKAPDFAPDLSTVGSKVTEAWLFRQAKEPHDYWAGTRMPSLRLDDRDAADVAAYLATQRDPAWEARTPEPVPDPAVAQYAAEAARFKAMASTDALGGKTPEEFVAGLSAEERLRLVGERALAKYGCHGCHDGIKGREGAERIGTELGGGEAWGSKDLDRIDFGLLMDRKAADRYAKDWGAVHLAKRRHEWAKQKLLNPRVFDAGITKTPDERLLMPNFGFTEAEAEDAVTFLLSLQREDIPASRRRMLTAQEQDAEKMRFLARQYNCYGCHTVTVDRLPAEGEEPMKTWDGKEKPRIVWEDVPRGRDVAPWLEDPKLWPPTLGGEGFEFLADLGKDGKKRWVPRDGGADLPVGVLNEKGEVVGADGKPLAHGITAHERGEADVDFKKVYRHGEPVRVYRGEGFKVQAPWLHDFLADPGTHALRPWLEMRMPTFGFTGAELNAFTRGFAAADGVAYPFEAQAHRHPSFADGMAEARELFQRMECAKCHPAAGTKPEPGSTPAPDLNFGSRRLRFEWVEKWLADPALFQPKTSMPNNWGSRPRKRPAGPFEKPYFGDDPREQMRRVAAYVMGLGDAAASGAK